jgi:predicted nucleic acid-binding protein
VADIQIDTNILLRSAEPSHPTNTKSVEAVKTLLENDDRLSIVPQNLIEFWNVATRPVENNGFGWTPVKTDAQITRLESLFTVLPDSQAIYREWRKLVLEHSVKGKQVHDARIVAAMNVHRITTLLTFNTSDFERFRHITLIHPASMESPS